MARSVLLLLAGAVTGAAAVYLYESPAARNDDPDSPAATAPVLSLPPVAAPMDSRAQDGYVAERLAIYEQAAEATEPFDIEALIESALDEPASRLRALKLTALVTRFAELDPRGAADFARTRYLDPALLVPIFEVWAESDPDAAIAELALIAPPGRQREIALAILDVIGNDADGIARVAAAFPAADVMSFETDAVLMRAESDPAAALREILAMPDYIRRTLTLQRVAEIAGRVDPRGALEQAAAIEEYALRRSFRNSVIAAWAGQDPEAVFAWLETADIGDLPESTGVYQALAREDPNRLFAVLEGLPPTVQTNAKRGAMQALAEFDPIAAIARIETMPAGQERDQLLTAVGQAYGRLYPDQALAWVRELPPAQSQNVLRSVLMGMMNTDPNRVVDIVIADLESAGQGGRVAALPGMAPVSVASLTTLSMLATNSQVDIGRVADRLLAVNNPQVASVISSMVGNWARQRPDEALRWALVNADRLNQDAFVQMAQGIAQTDSERALAMLNQVPPEQHAQWLTGVVQQIAQNDLGRAVDLISQYRGQPAYGAAYVAVAQATARTDPPRAAAMLREAPPGSLQQDASVYMLIASQWSRTDPEAAADWALGISDPQAQRNAISQVTQGWSRSDATAAERWVRAMNPGETRDTAAGALLSAGAQAGNFDSRVLDMFSSEQAAQNAAAGAIRTLGRTNQQEARRLLEQHITDARLRQQIQEYLDRSGGMGNPTITSSSGIIF